MLTNLVLGTVTRTIDNNNSISWSIDSLEPGKTATLKYKLKVKDINNAELLNKVLPTNEKILIYYSDNYSTNYSDTLPTSPKIKIVAQEVNNNVNYLKVNKNDNTIDSLDNIEQSVDNTTTQPKEPSKNINTNY